MKVFREIVLTLNIQCYQPLVQRNFYCVGENTLWKFATPTVFELDKKCRVKVINSRIRNGLKFLILLIKINKKRHWKNARKKFSAFQAKSPLYRGPLYLNRTVIDSKTGIEIGLTTKIYQPRFLRERYIFETTFTKTARNHWDALYPDVVFAQ